MAARTLGSLPRILFVFTLLFCFTVQGASKHYGERLCQEADYHCFTVDSRWAERKVRTRSGVKVVKTPLPVSWESLFPDEREREIVMKVNRMNIRPHRGMTLAVPREMSGKTYMDFSPFASRLVPECAPRGEPVCSVRCENCDQGGVEPRFKYVCVQECEPRERLSCGPDGEALKEKTIVFDPRLLAWAAYDERGRLVNWGPAAGGKDWCANINRPCRTVVGEFTIQSKRNRWAVSSLYPVARDGQPAGGAPVPYFMMFHRGYGFHASSVVPGAHASHGCVRMFYDDARWLNQEFAEVGDRVIVRPY